MAEYVRAEASTGIYVGRKNEQQVCEFLGIRYVKPPKRWQPAEKLEKSDKVITALECGPACWQVIAPEEFELGEPPMSEDCLTLNVWTSDVTGKKPVYVFIHGGAYQTGANRTECFGGVYCGDRLVAGNPDIVYVNINYRTGIIGSANLTLFDTEGKYKDSANIQTLDQLRALEWVHENIAAFGGDPDNVTVGGQSAGACSVFTLMMIPEALQYFQKAICESASPTDAHMKDITTSRHQGQVIADASGAVSLQELLDTSVEKLMDYEMAVVEAGIEGPFEACRDGRLIPLMPLAEFRKGTASKLKVMTGTTCGEFSTVTMSLNPDEIKDLILTWFPDVTEEDIAAFKANNPERDEKITMEDMFYDLNMRIGQIVTTEALVAGGNEVYYYFINYVPDGAGIRTQHCFEIPYVTDKLDAVIYMEAWTGETILGEHPDPKLQKEIQGCWLNFIRSGNPNGDHIPVKWQPYTLENKETMIIDREWHQSGEVRPEDVAVLKKYQLVSNV